MGANTTACPCAYIEETLGWDLSDLGKIRIGLTAENLISSKLSSLFLGTKQ